MSGFISTATGFTNHDAGYTGAFSWCRSCLIPGKWYVCGHGQFAKSGYAVTDDFGTLVEVTA